MATNLTDQLLLLKVEPLKLLNQAVVARQGPCLPKTPKVRNIYIIAIFLNHLTSSNYFLGLLFRAFPSTLSNFYFVS